jgi:histidyl-tRNA synthetase
MPKNTSYNYRRSGFRLPNPIEDRAYETYDKALDTATHFGFSPVKAPNRPKNCKDVFGKTQKTLKMRENLLHHYFHNGFDIDEEHTSPTMVCFEQSSSNEKEQELHLEMLDFADSLADALLIQTAVAILKDADYSNVEIEINSLGTKTSFAEFEKEFGAFTKKHKELIPEEYQDREETALIELLTIEDILLDEFKANAPRPFNYLTESSQRHFMEVLEYLENLSIPYHINCDLLGPHKDCSETIFRIQHGRGKKREFLPSLGYHYTDFSNQLGYTKNIPAIGLNLRYNRNKERPSSKGVRPVCFYFIHLGFEARLKSLSLIESLRKVDIFIHHSLDRMKCGDQMRNAEQTNVPFILIMGKKEAMENTIIVRNTVNREQYTIPFSQIVRHLRNLEKVMG